jgi:hypothetical protein
MEPVFQRSSFSPLLTRSRGVYWSIFTLALTEVEEKVAACVSGVYFLKGQT